MLGRGDATAEVGHVEQPEQHEEDEGNGENEANAEREARAPARRIGGNARRAADRARTWLFAFHAHLMPIPYHGAQVRQNPSLVARFGYVFSKPKWQEQFGKLPWYKPDPTFTEAKLSPLAKANVQKLKDLKAKHQGCQ